MLPLFAVVLLSGCLTIEEHYSFKRNGSGTMEYVVDISELMGLMESFSGDDEEGGGAPPASGMDMTSEVEALKQLPGISKVKLDTRKKWVQRISFKFKDVDALNSALNVIMADSSGASHTFFRWEGDTLVRTSNRHAYELGAGLSKTEDAGEEEAGEEDGLDLDAMLGSMNYSFSFKFARPITLSGVAEGVERTDRSSREFVLDTDFSVIGKDPKALDLRIAVDR